jgi:hypothetical protein
VTVAKKQSNTSSPDFSFFFCRRLADWAKVGEYTPLHHLGCRHWRDRPVREIPACIEALNT